MLDTNLLPVSWGGEIPSRKRLAALRSRSDGACLEYSCHSAVVVLGYTGEVKYGFFKVPVKVRFAQQLAMKVQRMRRAVALLFL